MKVSLFDFDLPEDRIALRPAVPRESARMLTVGPDGFSDRRIAELPDLLCPGDLLVVNDTKVIPARLRGRRGAAKIEVTLHMRMADGVWAAFARPAKRLRQGDLIEFDGLTARVRERREGGETILDFERGDAELAAALQESGETPLPPYITARRPADARDRADYQTMFAAHEGAVAAPTAGLHLTPALVRRLDAAGVGIARLTLHVGAGTFLPVKVEDTGDHRMHTERGEITAATAARINGRKGRLIAVGTTSLRLLESAADERGRIGAFTGATDIFIAPGVGIHTADLLLTNFHLPRSTLFMLVAGFSGLKRMQAAYAHAIGQGYRFYSYGDACLLQRMPE